MITIACSFSGQPRRASVAAYRQLLAENHVDEILVEVKQNGKKEMKKQLPVWIPQAAGFSGEKRVASAATPSGLYFLDIDEKGLTEALFNKVREEGLIDEFRIVYFAESAGGGTHIWAWRNPGLSIEEDIQRLAARLGVGYDPHVTDLSRCCFMVSEQYVRLLDERIFDAAPFEEAPQPATEPAPSQDTTVPEAYKDIPYGKIVSHLLYKMGYGDCPVEGERNQALYSLTRYMRFICDFNEQTLFTLLPHWGLPDHEVLSTIKSAVGSVRPSEPPTILKEVLAFLAEAERQESACTIISDDDEPTANIAKDMPSLLQLLADHAPEEFKEATVMAALPMLGTLATGLRARYRDGKLNSPSFITSIWAPQATGKSFVDDLMELLLDPIIRQDEVEWQKEIDFSLAKKDEAAADPMSQIRIIEPTIGVSAFLKRAICAKGKHLFTYAPEIETVTKNNRGGAWTEKNDLFRLAYDNKKWGQHRISKDSFSGKVTLYYNMLMCGTPETSRGFFSNTENGLVSRVSFVELPDMMGARMPQFAPWDKDAQESVRRQCICLMDEDGEVELPRLNQALEDWDEGKREEYLQTLQPSLDVFRRRAALNGFRAGMLAYVLDGRQETDRVIDFALWYAERCLYYQMKLFGSQIDAAYSGFMNTEGLRHNIRYLEALGKEFTKEDLVKLRQLNGESPVVKTIICRWVKEKKIVKTGNNVWRKC